MTNQHPADTYGVLKAKLAELEDATAAVRDQIIALGLGEHEGDLFAATVTMVPRKSIDWKAVAYTLRPSFEYPRKKWSDEMVAMVEASTNATESVRVTCNAKPRR